MENNRKYKFAELRRQAEALKAEGHNAGIALSDEIAELIHDLEVHHIELELQHVELERTNALLEKTRQEYADLFDFAPIGYLILDRESNIVRANLTASALLRTDRAKLVGQNLSTFLKQSDKDLLYIHRRDLFNNKEPQRFTADINTPDASVLSVQVNMEPVQDNPDLCRVALVDISILKTAESRLKQALFREQELNQLKAKLINVISYEVPAPLNRALLIVDLLLSDQNIDNPQVLKHLKLVEHNIWYINNFIKDVLMAYQLNDLPFQVTFESFDIVEFSKNIADDFEAQNDTNRIKFVSNIDTKIVLLDRNLLRRSIISLLNNALKYSTEEIEFRLHADHNRVTIHVTDFGRGISPEDEPYVFQLFYRGGNVEDIPGFGLGLSVVKSAVEALNGTVSLSSVEHQRTTVTLRIPTQQEVDSGSG